MAASGTTARSCATFRAVSRRAAALGFAALVIVAAGCGDDEQDIPDNQQPIPETDVVITQAPVATEIVGTEGVDVASPCPPAEQPAPRTDGGLTAPTETLDPALTWTLTFDTTCGSFVVTLDPALALQATASLVALADAGFFDDIAFHRIVPGFVVQGGDQTGTGGGGPGYQTVDEPPADASYTRGVVAMAKATSEPPGTAGSQFFIVVGENANLPAEYAIVGEVTEGLDVVEVIGTLGDPATEKPTQVIVINSVTAASTG
jgi:cyclophilin family peptidyl-prolyl cis-trans isomerase